MTHHLILTSDGRGNGVAVRACTAGDSPSASFSSPPVLLAGSTHTPLEDLHGEALRAPAILAYCPGVADAFLLFRGVQNGEQLNVIVKLPLKRMSWVEEALIKLLSADQEVLSRPLLLACIGSTIALVLDEPLGGQYALCINTATDEYRAGIAMGIPEQGLDYRDSYPDTAQEASLTVGGVPTTLVVMKDNGPDTAVLCAVPTHELGCLAS